MDSSITELSALQMLPQEVRDEISGLVLDVSHGIPLRLTCENAREHVKHKHDLQCISAKAHIPHLGSGLALTCQAFRSDVKKTINRSLKFSFDYRENRSASSRTARSWSCPWPTTVILWAGSLPPRPKRNILELNVRFSDLRDMCGLFPYDVPSFAESLHACNFECIVCIEADLMAGLDGSPTVLRVPLQDLSPGHEARTLRGAYDEAEADLTAGLEVAKQQGQRHTVMNYFYWRQPLKRSRQWLQDETSLLKT